jgi:hypothetical protein
MALVNPRFGHIEHRLTRMSLGLSCKTRGPSWGGTDPRAGEIAEGSGVCIL